MSEILINYIPHPKQKMFHGSNAFETLYIGGRRSGKTDAGCMEAWLLSYEYPGNVGLITRKRYTDLMDTTIASWKKRIPPELYSINEGKHIITVFTGQKHNSIIYYRGLDVGSADDRVHKNRGLETGWQLWDQAEEMTQSDIDEAIPCMSFKLPDGSLPHYRVMYLANPQRCYILDKFQQHMTPNMELIQTSIFDNQENLAAGVIDRIRDQYKNNKKMYAAMIDGSLEFVDEPNIIIPYEKILKASKRLQQLGYFDKKVISIDVAREGDDMTQIYAWHGSKVVDEEHYGKKDLDVTAARAVIMQNKWGCNCICWDADGIGGGLMSNIKGLVSRGTKLIEFRGNGKSSNPMYYNQRAEAYYDLQELCMNDLLSFEMNKITPETISEISRIKSEYKLGKILVEDKAEIKKKFNKSPDQADALAYGAWALKRAPSMITEPAVGKGTMRELITQIDEKLEDELNNKYVIGNHNADRE